MFSAFKDSIFALRPDQKVSTISLWGIGGDILLMIIHFVFWNFMLLIIELGAFSWVKRILNFIPKNKISPKQVLEQD